ncbi:DMT family transporter [Actinomadura opuntiae]|uniref:DMT family transporter n=1 Tax=Actinomadura sp. OS1-43 TaxID=604315 RepID=UPI00255AACB1|nr:DMT family transporter [Actinomadura sp. OS1-43]MDL4815756.1 DMT family transporter [Actinomadura sp. OS1-43]
MNLPSLPPGAGGRGTAAAGAAMFLVGTLTAVSATISHYPVFGGQAVRYAVAALILLGVARLRGGPARRPTAREWALLAALAGTGLVAFNVCIVAATRDTSPATIGTVIGAVPVALAIAGPLMEGRRPAPALIASACVVAAGAALASGFGGGSLRGLLLSLGALGGEMCFSLLAVPLLPALGPVRVSAYSAVLAAPMLLVIGLVTEGSSVLRAPTRAEFAGLAYLSVVVTVVAFLLWYGALGRLGADRAGLFAGMIPVSAVVTTVVLGLGRPGPADIAGAVLVAAGVVLGLRRRVVPCEAAPIGIARGSA